MFKFKEFTIMQDKAAMKVGTDGVLLGAWVKIKTNDEYILDIGCGTGLIALMMAQRSEAIVDAVEIDAASAEQAAENAATSKWAKRVVVHNIDINHLPTRFNYDLIVSNPPYFSDSLQSPNEALTNAKHTTSLSFDELIGSALRLMAVDGRFALILPAEESAIFAEKVEGHLYLWSRCDVKSRVGDDKPKRVMSEYRLIKPRATQYDELAIREAEGDEYTAEYKILTRDFYLKF